MSKPNSKPKQSFNSDAPIAAKHTGYYMAERIKISQRDILRRMIQKSKGR